MWVTATRNGTEIKIDYGMNFTLKDQVFKYWKLMAANGTEVAVYPDQSAIKVGTEMSDTHFKEWKDGERYYRICLITKRMESHPSFNDGVYGRYCSNVVQVSRNTNTSTESDKYEDDKYEDVRPTTKPIAQTLKDNIDKAIENMVMRLKSQYSDDQIADMLQPILKKIDEIAQKRPEIAHIAMYMKTQIQAQIDMLRMGDLLDLLN